MKHKLAVAVALLDRGALPDEEPAEEPKLKKSATVIDMLVALAPCAPLDKDQLRSLAWSAVALTMERLHGRARHESETSYVLTAFIRATNKVGSRNIPLACAMVTRLHFFGPAWVTDALAFEPFDGVDAMRAMLGRVASTPNNMPRVTKLAAIE